MWPFKKTPPAIVEVAQPKRAKAVRAKSAPAPVATAPLPEEDIDITDIGQALGRQIYISAELDRRLGIALKTLSMIVQTGGSAAQIAQSALSQMR